MNDEEESIYQNQLLACKNNHNSKTLTYSLVVPPPNVTGTLHLGHGFNNTLQDILVRFFRKKGYAISWKMGVDHASIATQMVVERSLLAQGIKRADIGRDAFLEYVWKWKEESGGTIVSQQKRLRLSPDWDDFHFTMDHDFSYAVIKVFVDLYNEGLIYRAKRLVNWDIHFQTALSDLEVIKKEEMGKMYYIPYYFEEDPSQFLTVATTRPETMFGDTAVAVHPKDPRFSHAIGKRVLIPIVNKSIPVIADHHCDPEKGSGVVKITPAHDFNDYEVGKRHGLEMISILDKKGCLTPPSPPQYVGLSVQEARAKIEHDLEGPIHIKEHLMAKPYADRSGCEIQPMLTDQWFLNVDDMAKEAVRTVKEKHITFFPKTWENVFYQWMEAIEPWCISRQLWWGHRIPAWYNPSDERIFVAMNVHDAHAKARLFYGKDVELVQDHDVLDTWFSASLWPFVTFGWPKDTEDLERFFTTDILVTGFDIIFFWVARMIMMSLKLTKKVPFKTVYIHGLIKDEKGQKMSKTKGNVIDPLEMMDIYGVDALRFAFCEAAAPVKDFSFSVKRIEKARNFLTKIKNAKRFLDMNTQNQGLDPSHPLCAWITHEFYLVSRCVDESLAGYRFDLAASAIYTFFWDKFCDIFVEGSKPYGGTGTTGKDLFVQFLHVLHPICPMISDELFGVFPQTLTTLPYPKLMEPEPINLDDLLCLINNIRSLRGMLGIASQAHLDIHIETAQWKPYEACLKLAEHLTKTRMSLVDHFAQNAQERPIPVGVGKKQAMIILQDNDNISLNDVITTVQKKATHIGDDMLKIEKKLQNMSYKQAKPEAYENDQILFQKRSSERALLQTVLQQLNA